MRSPSKKVIRPSPGELERKTQEEISRRRKERIAQARSQSLSRGRDVGRDSNSASQKKLLEHWKSTSRDLINDKLMKLETLEAQKSHLLQNLGSGREDALREMDISKAKASLAQNHLRASKERGATALKEEISHQRMSNLLAKKSIDMKKTALFNEKVRSRRILKQNTNFQEFNAAKGILSSKSVPSSEFFVSGDDKENIRFIRNSLPDNTNGYAQAQSEPLAFQIPPREPLKIRRLQQEAALKIRNAKAEFMNINETKSFSQEEGSPLIRAKIIRGPPHSHATTSEERSDAVAEVDSGIKKDCHILSKRSSEDPTVKMDCPSSSSDSKSSVPPSSLSSLEVSFNKNVPERGPSGAGLSLNVAELSSSTVESSSREDLTSSDAQHSLESSSDLQVTDKLREYIDKCLNMRRDELDDLSSLTASILGNSISSTSSSSFNTTTPPPSILSSNSKKKILRREKSVRFSSSTSDEEQHRPQEAPLKVNIPSSLSLDFLSEGILTSPSSSDYLANKEGIISSPPSSKIDSLKDKIFNMEMPVLRRADKMESSSTFISSSIFFSSSDSDDKASKIESFDRNTLSSSISSTGHNSC